MCDSSSIPFFLKKVIVKWLKIFAVAFCFKKFILIKKNTDNHRLYIKKISISKNILRIYNNFPYLHDMVNPHKLGKALPWVGFVVCKL